MVFQRSVERKAYSNFNFFALNWSKTYWNTLYLNFQAERKVWDGKSWYCQVPISLRYLVTTIEGWPKADAIGLKIASTTKNLRWLQCGLQNYGYEIPELGARLLSSCLFDYRLVHLHHQTKSRYQEGFSWEYFTLSVSPPIKHNFSLNFPSPIRPEKSFSFPNFFNIF